MNLDMAPFLEPLRFSIVLACPAADAFRLFTEEIHEWWPLATHSIAQAQARSCRFEPHRGGRVVETTADGTEHLWAEIAVWDPPRRFVLLWHPGLPASRAQDVEVTFEDDGGRTRVVLEHRDWQQGDAERRSQYASGWATVLEQRLVPFAHSALPSTPSAGGAAR